MLASGGVFRHWKLAAMISASLGVNCPFSAFDIASDALTDANIPCKRSGTTYECEMIERQCLAGVECN